MAVSQKTEVLGRKNYKDLVNRSLSIMRRQLKNQRDEL